MGEPHFLPSWLDKHLISDQAFGQAYESLGDRERGLLKACLARLFDRHPPRPGWRVEETGNPRAGFLTLAHGASLDYAVLVLSPEFSSPSRLLAALLPLITAGTPEVLVAFTRAGKAAKDPSPPAPALLTALELAGQEQACLLFPEAASRLAEACRRARGAGLAVFLGGTPGPEWGSFPGRMGAGLRLLAAPEAAEAGVWMDNPDDFDLAALRFAHPDLRFFVWGPCGRLPDKGFSRRKGDMDRFCAEAYDAVYVSEEHMAAYLGAAPLVLGPGQESCWTWPELTPETFIRPRLGWFAWQAQTLEP